ncbi:hypothetical protein LTR78_009481 [Recurvomyces mirabilis]|uniref:SnoaL-like domain-containing protein n=1 Tax=Recurvomyces mirabilis TaxID=574656 RepID=A0AAE0TRJ5_9PEZI|nr:hypothetical protein LTR78_009481 [Recurvomyces mirabilis]KAK5152386.1 hypothetical protein LTS14_008333 [Recurvomyces mirabilis]
MPSAKENQITLVKEAMLAEESWDMDRILSLRTSDSTHQLLPPSMGWPRLNNYEFKEKFSPLAPVFKGCFRLEPLNTVHDFENHKAVVWCMNTADTATHCGRFEIETIWQLQLTDDGTKIKAITEFVDSAYLLSWLGKLEAGDVAVP